MHQHADRLGQDRIQPLRMTAAKRVEQVAIHRDPAENPQVGEIPLAKFRQVPPAGNPFRRREQPQREQDPRVDRVAASPTLHRLNVLIKRRQIETADIFPKVADRMVLTNQLVWRKQQHLRLPPLRILDPDFQPRRILGSIHGDLSAGSGAGAVSRDLDFGREFLIRRQDRIVFGTDFLAPKQDVPQFELFETKLKLPDEVGTKIFRGNARKLLGLA